MEKPKMPKFGGNVRDYHIFKSDFTHMVGKVYSKRDSITILRSALYGKPLEMVRGIGSDYDAAWEYLDSVYGDPRFTADAIINDINKFKAVKEGEDSRFCELVNLVRTSYNALKEVGRPHDMDNSQMLALIERKLNMDDRKVWFRYLEREGKQASLSVLIDWLTSEMKSRIRATAPLRSETSKSGAAVHVVGKESDAKKFHKCWLCESTNHWTDQCQTFLNLTPAQRWQHVKEHHGCFSCLKKAGRDHRMSNCRRKRACSEVVNGTQCGQFHHPLLHLPAGSVSGIVGVALNTKDQALLPVVEVDIEGPRGMKQRGNILLDSGAQISLIRTSLAEQLNLKGKNVNITITKVGGEQEQMQTKKYQLKIRPLTKSGVYSISAVGLPCISEELKYMDVDETSKLFGLKPDDVRRGNGSVDILIGIDYAHLHCGDVRQAGHLVARNSPLGWLIFGSSATQEVVASSVLHVKLSSPVDLTDFWTSESMGVNPSSCECKPNRSSKLEADEGKIISDSCEKVGTQWLIPYPWRKDAKLLPDNRSQAERTLRATEKRLSKNPEYAEAYKREMMEMVEMKFARKLTEKDIKQYKGPVHYISHHAVIRPEKRSTPVRIVFNSSAVFQGHCLNDYWLKGPDLLNNLFGVILRFREHKVATCGDISKMYHRILIPETDQHVHRYLWRDMQIDRTPEVFVKTVLTFGDRPAPAMAQVALLKTAKEGEQQHPRAAQALRHNTYMDDICLSNPTIEDAAEITHGIDEVLKGGGFKVKEWLSSQPLGERSEVSKENVKSFTDETKVEKVLGVVWDHENDKFSYKVNLKKSLLVQNSESGELQRLTKRKILSQVAQIFDPVGFASAFVIRAKIGLQHLWQKGLDWDSELSERDEEKWRHLFKEMENLNALKFERCLTPVNGRDPILCIFSDASEFAFGTCAYIRWQVSNDSYDVRFLTAKSRVAPLKRLTIPRLELQGAVLAARLSCTILEELTLKPVKVMFMIDSTIVLGWIQSNARGFKPFVSARVGEIQTVTDPSQWFYVPSEHNIADDVSRGISVEQLKGRWECGPEFLHTPEEEWPLANRPNLLSVEAEGECERRNTQQVFMVKETQIINCENFSNWRRLLRVTAYVFRFVQNLKARCQKSQEPKTQETRALDPSELKEAETFWIKDAQRLLHTRLKCGEFKTLSPFVENDLIRVGGRAKSDLISYDMGHPVLLPQKHHVSKLITQHYHSRGHNGVACTAAKVREKYWILGVHRLAKTVKYRCVTCKVLARKAESQVMASLPKERLAPFTPPFFYTSCDYFGPLQVKVGRNKVTKHYGVIFTCLNTRAVHLELSVDCSTMEFLQVIRRFFAIRGQPVQILSDNGTQFVGAEKELRLMIQGWSDEQLKEFCAERQTEWKFTTPSAPHQNGCAESLVKSCKMAIRRAIGEQVLTVMELNTCLQEIANLVNQRPIGRIPTDPDDGRYLCPNDMLLGRASRDVPQGPFRETRNPRHRVEFVQKIVDSFWRRWTRDVLPLLVPRRKWDVHRRNVRVDDIVMMVETNAVRGKWILGRVVQVYPGSDGKVRNLRVKTSTTEFCRPVTKIAVIYPAEGYEDD
ncbi:hypothetical protein HOLleu_20672 [Holothuria leucospilota]|uniref:Integrase catalytic domain-containing protein n=1 Tax=Holothuria leucospilota TaxID=206669 RepID=A0A9Q1C1H1_HOLLE|nr:hypothetical protein HOLleu_20672 [Holothuria leucospilota]